MYSAVVMQPVITGTNDADAFSLFKENGIFDKKTAEAFRKNILEKGDTEEPMTLYVRFRGREPEIEAMMRRDGIK